MFWFWFCFWLWPLFCSADLYCLVCGFRPARSATHALYIVRKLMRCCEYPGSFGCCLFLDGQRRSIERDIKYDTRRGLVQRTTVSDSENRGWLCNRHLPGQAGSAHLVSAGADPRGPPGLPTFAILIRARPSRVVQDTDSELYFQHKDFPLHENFVTDVEYADDTTLMGESGARLGMHIRALQKHAAQQGLRLHTDKTVLIALHASPRIRLAAGTVVHEVKYLSCPLDENFKIQSAIRSRIATCTAVTQN